MMKLADFLAHKGDSLPARTQQLMALQFPDGVSSAQVIENADMTVTTSTRVASYIDLVAPFWVIQTLYKNAGGVIIGIKTECSEEKPSWIPAGISSSLGV